ncbi:MAG: sulfatase-like hydrolase/transferase, partial [Rhodospirillales bacterium]|nr:sulfatase-like hydrolase/transferase [Rhodospirillales bacterium]
GKWHLSDVRNGWQDHPNLVGFDHFSGLVRCCPESYFAWVHLENGDFSTRTGYAVTDKVDDAIKWLGDPSERDAPWLLWLAFNTPHSPIHMPPRDLLQSDFSDFEDAYAEQQDPRFFDAMLEAMDTEIGRLLDHIGPDVLDNTYVLFIGDNGTGSNAVREPFRPGYAKGTLYNGGIHVPFIIAGPGVASGAASDALVNSADLFATLLELAGIDSAEAVPEGTTVDSVSLVPYLSNPGRESIRQWVYADSFTTDAGLESGAYTMRNQRYKLLVNQGVEHFFDLQADPYEHNDLMTGDLSGGEQAQLDSLRAQIAALHGSEG